ncbi:MAG: hypothetical protein OEW64_11075 [Gammaproteobacteria bacterium]|nr:hypothetical protein [Gammaproteobacteria bacterium]MDH5304621.1 hypothetical protein [Gammaproteobacteria bacterium]MDH5322077.1 hypothetical protein [Gammaproteobacteria bacterium]
MFSKTTWPACGLAAAAIVLLGFGSNFANATAPCGDFGECKVLVEINATDGDIGFHFLMDGDNLIHASLYNPQHRRIFSYVVRRELREQFLTETFAESAEPLCFDPLSDDDEENDDEDFVTLEEFLDRWSEGEYHFFGIGEDWQVSHGASTLSFKLPAAPTELDWETEEQDGDVEGEISWEAGDDLGECSDGMEQLPMAPAEVAVRTWEVVFEPDVEDDDPVKGMKYTVRIPGDSAELEVEVPDDYLETLPENTPAKVEVGAIGFDDNATFTELGDICVNENDPDEGDNLDGCGFEIEEDDD